MTVKLRCTKCDTLISLPDEAAEKLTNCPSCGAQMRVMEAAPRSTVPTHQPAATSSAHLGNPDERTSGSAPAVRPAPRISRTSPSSHVGAPPKPPAIPPPLVAGEARLATSPNAPTRPPAVYGWFAAYCVLMAMCYFFLGGMCSIALLPDRDTRIGGVIVGLLTIPFVAVQAVGPLMPRNKFGWFFGCLNICLGMTNLCTMIPCIFLLIGWARRETRQYYGMH